MLGTPGSHFRIEFDYVKVVVGAQLVEHALKGTFCLFNLSAVHGTGTIDYQDHVELVAVGRCCRAFFRVVEESVQDVATAIFYKRYR